MAGAAKSGEFAKARHSGIPPSILKIKDPTLRRLAIAEALAKAGFNPDEPRDERGRWTREGGDEDDRPLIEGRSVATAVAAGWKVLWFFAELGPAAYFRKHAVDNKLTDIQVFFAPAVAP
jgi:hypothetical protein